MVQIPILDHSRISKGETLQQGPAILVQIWLLTGKITTSHGDLWVHSSSRHTGACRQSLWNVFGVGLSSSCQSDRKMQTMQSLASAGQDEDAMMDEQMRERRAELEAKLRRSTRSRLPEVGGAVPSALNIGPDKAQLLHTALIAIGSMILNGPNLMRKIVDLSLWGTVQNIATLYPLHPSLVMSHTLLQFLRRQ